MKPRRNRLRGYNLLFVLPFLIFMVVMVIIPLSMLFYYAFFMDGSFTFEYFRIIFTDGNTLRLMWQSVWIALLGCLICFVIAYPIAYGLAFAGFKRKTTILLLFTLPLWINLLLRSVALHQVFTLLGFEQGLTTLLIAIALNFVTIMILPIYLVLSNINKKYLEASADLGAPPHRTFWRITLPLSTPGIVAGFILVFTPAASSYFLAVRFGNYSTRMFGETLDRLLETGHFAFGSVISIMFLGIVVLGVLSLNFLTRKGNKRGGLW